MPPKSSGICACGNPSMPHRKDCVKCNNVKARERKARYYAKQKKNEEKRKDVREVPTFRVPFKTDYDIFSALPIMERIYG